MLVFAAAALASAEPGPHHSATLVQATATIRIITAVHLKLDAAVNPGAPRAHDSRIRIADGSIAIAKLIEFQ